MLTSQKAGLFELVFLLVIWVKSRSYVFQQWTEAESLPIRNSYNNYCESQYFKFPALCVVNSQLRKTKKSSFSKLIVVFYFQPSKILLIFCVYYLLQIDNVCREQMTRLYILLPMYVCVRKLIFSLSTTKRKPVFLSTDCWLQNWL